MNAKRFNQLYPPGTRFMHIAHRVRGGRVVKLLHLPEILNGCVAEINVEPYFVKVKH